MFAICEMSGAHIEVEKLQGKRLIFESILVNLSQSKSFWVTLSQKRVIGRSSCNINAVSLWVIYSQFKSIWVNLNQKELLQWGSCSINAIREMSGAHIEVEKLQGKKFDLNQFKTILSQLESKESHQ